MTTGRWRSTLSRMTQRTARRPVLPASPFNALREAKPVERLAVDDRLTHDRHGLGRVIGVESESIVLVDFGSTIRRVSYPNAKVTRL
jgi:hypothetical protein